MIKPKYAVGDTVYLVGEDYIPIKACVCAVATDDTGIGHIYRYYFTCYSGFWADERLVHATVDDACSGAINAVNGSAKYTIKQIKEAVERLREE